MNTVQHYPLIIFFSEEDAGLIAEAPDFPELSRDLAQNLASPKQAIWH